MVGRNVQLTVDRGESHPRPASSSTVSGLRAKDDRGREVVRGVDLEVRAGEIARHRRRRRQRPGRARRGDHRTAEARRRHRLDARHRRDRLGASEALRGGSRPRPGRPSPLGDDHEFPLEDNLVLTSYYRPPFARGPVRQDAAIDDWAKQLIERYDIRTPSPIVTRGDAVRREPAEGVVAREFSARAEGPGPGPADARPGCRQHRVHPPPSRSRCATPGRGSCSSRPSSTRSSSCPTGSPSCTAASWSATLRRSEGEQGGGRPAHGDRRPRGRNERADDVTGRQTPSQPSPSGGADASGRSSPSRRSRCVRVPGASSSPASSSWSRASSRPARSTGRCRSVAYAALFQGAFGSESAIFNTILQATPLILGGLAVGIGFKAGLFNIGGQGQFLLAATAAAGVGAALATAPAPIAILAALRRRDGGGGILGLDPRRPQGPVRRPRGRHDDHAQLDRRRPHRVAHPRTPVGPGLLVRPDRRSREQRAPDHPRHQHPRGVILAVAAVPAVWWLLYRTHARVRDPERRREPQRGAICRDAAEVPDHARRCRLSGLLFGIAGSIEILGVSHFMIPSYGTSIGFDAIAVALLGRSHPFGILLAALLFGALRAALA